MATVIFPFRDTFLTKLDKKIQFEFWARSMTYFTDWRFEKATRGTFHGLNPFFFSSTSTFKLRIDYLVSGILRHIKKSKTNFRLNTWKNLNLTRTGYTLENFRSKKLISDVETSRFHYKHMQIYLELDQSYKPWKTNSHFWPINSKCWGDIGNLHTGCSNLKRFF